MSYKGKFASGFGNKGFLEVFRYEGVKDKEELEKFLAPNYRLIISDKNKSASIQLVGSSTKVECWKGTWLKKFKSGFIIQEISCFDKSYEHLDEIEGTNIFHHSRDDSSYLITYKDKGGWDAIEIMDKDEMPPEIDWNKFDGVILSIKRWKEYASRHNIEIDEESLKWSPAKTVADDDSTFIRGEIN